MTHPLYGRSRGFTLVELMVAVTGGLFVAIAVFMLARHGSRFYREQARAADATMSAIVGFGRLKADLGRAGFMASPNLNQDPSRCPAWNPGWPDAIRNMASLFLETPPTPTAVMQANNLTPQSLRLAGNYTSNDEFPIWGTIVSGSGYIVTLQTRIGPLPRLGYLSMAAANQLALLNQLFPVSRALRIVDPAGRTHYGTIVGAQIASNGDPQIVLGANPVLQLRGVGAQGCALAGSETGTANVVNFIRYSIRSMAGVPAYAPLFDQSNPGEIASWEDGRTELVREELDVQGSLIAGTQEIVAEYAVDLRIGLTVVNATQPQGTQTDLTTLTAFDIGNAQVEATLTNPAVANFMPQRVRAVRTRLAVRSRVPDRQGPIVGASGTPIAPGFYRMQLATGVYARVRTLQADVALPNHGGIQW